MPPAKGTKYAKRQTTPEMVEAARNRTQRAAKRHTPTPEHHAKMQAGRVASREQREREERATRINAELRREAASEHPAIQLYRETRRARMPEIKRREAKIMQHVKEAVDAADARAHELRHRGRPKNTHRLPPLFIRKSPDALIAAVSDWHGER